MANPKCPECGAPLERVRYGGGYLNEDQFNSIRAGDWFCGNVEITHSPQRLRGRDQHLAYWWNRELTPMATPQEPPAADDVGALVKRMRKRLPMLPRYSRDAELLAEAAGELVRLAAHVEALQAEKERVQRCVADVVNEYEELQQATESYGREMAVAALGLAVQELQNALGLPPSTSEGRADGE